MNYGAYFGLSASIIYLIFYFTGAEPDSKMPQYLGYLLQIIFIAMGIVSYRDNELQGSITYGNSLKTGVLISLFGGIITGAFTVLFFTVIAPDMAQKIMDMTQEKMLEEGMSEEIVSSSLSYMQKFMSPIWLFIFSLISAIFMGFLFSLLISVFTKKDKNPFQQTIG